MKKYAYGALSALLSTLVFSMDNVDNNEKKEALPTQVQNSEQTSEEKINENLDNNVIPTQNEKENPLDIKATTQNQTVVLEVSLPKTPVKNDNNLSSNDNLKTPLKIESPSPKTPQAPKNVHDITENNAAESLAAYMIKFQQMTHFEYTQKIWTQQGIGFFEGRWKEFKEKKWGADTKSIMKCHSILKLNTITK